MKHCIACNTQYGDDIETCPTDGTTLYSTENQQAPDALIGMLLDKKYRIEKRLGEGGMGVVYLATHIHIESTVAIKVLHKDMVSNPQSVERFRREARAAGRIKHPNAISVMDFGVGENNLVYIVMEYLEGMTLSQRIRKTGRVMPEETVAIMRDVCAALDAAHNKGVIHRDLKPDNIILQKVDGGKDRVKVLDFGIAQLKSLSGVSMELTQQGTVIGTPFYMSPEQCRGEELDKRSDVYSLGIILFEMLTGKLPFQAESAMAVIVKHMTEQPPRLREIQPDIPALFEVVTLRALAKGKAERQGSAAELGLELDNALAKSKLKPGQAPIVDDPYKTMIRGETKIVGGPAGSETEVIGGQVTSPIHPEGEAGARTEVISASPSTGLDAGAGSYSPTVVTSAGAGTARGTPASGNYETTVMPGGSTALPAGATPARGGYTARLEEQRRTSRMSLYVSIGAVVVLIAGLAIGWQQFKSRTQPSDQTTQGVVTPPAPVVPEHMKNLILIPASTTFKMGRDDGGEEVTNDEKPAHVVPVPSFYISKYEVTNQEYKKFVDEASYPPPPPISSDEIKTWAKTIEGATPPSDWKGKDFPSGAENEPVRNVSWNDAMEYCKWLSRKNSAPYRLPSEAEWEYAAKGDKDQRIYPWGDEFDPGNANSLERWIQIKAKPIPLDVTRYSETRSPFSTANQAGNVAEWTASTAAIYPGSKYKEIEGEWKIYRGGSFFNQKLDMRTTARFWKKAEARTFWLGFRVAMDLQPVAAN